MDGLSFANKSNLNKHNRNFHQNKLEKCKFCQSYFYPINEHEKYCKSKKNINEKCKDINGSNSDNEIKIENIVTNIYQKEQNNQIKFIEKKEERNASSKKNNDVKIKKKKLLKKKI